MTRFPIPEDVRQLNDLLKRQPELTETMGPVALLQVPGRKSGQLRATPVAPLVTAGQRWLVAGFATADWVQNLRHAGWGILTKGTHSDHITVVEVLPSEGAPIIQAFVQQMEHARGDTTGPSGHFAFAIDPAAPLEAFAAISAHHPVFRILDSRPLVPQDAVTQ